jgi:hypothetical protein
MDYTIIWTIWWNANYTGRNLRNTTVEYFLLVYYRFLARIYHLIIHNHHPIRSYVLQL